MKAIRGIMLNAWLEFLRKKYGADPVNKAIGTLPQEERTQFEKSILDASWYPIEMTRILGKIQTTVGGREDVAEELGKYLAEYTFKGTYKVFLVKDPLTQAKKIANALDYFYRNVHKFEVETTGPHSCIMRYITERKPSAATCVSRRSWWVQTLEMSGAKLLKLTHPRCMVNGHSSCEFEVEWQQPS
jgi:hypothetical protein